MVIPVECTSPVDLALKQIQEARFSCRTAGASLQCGVEGFEMIKNNSLQVALGTNLSSSVTRPPAPARLRKYQSKINTRRSHTIAHPTVIRLHDKNCRVCPCACYASVWAGGCSPQGGYAAHVSGDGVYREKSCEINMRILPVQR